MTFQSVLQNIPPKYMAGSDRPGALPTRAFLCAALFLAAVGVLVQVFVIDGAMAGIVVISAVVGGYMALNIGANDVANNVGPAVGSGALSMAGAIGIAIIFESAGALLAGGEVVSTISKGIVDASAFDDQRAFTLAMLAALGAGALWLNLATWVGAPVSTTHSIVGGVLGGAVAAGSFAVVDWAVMSRITASWFISPILGGVIAAGFLAAIDAAIFSKRDMVAAGRKWVPVFLGVMASAFAVYLMTKGLKKVWKPEPFYIAVVAVFIFAAASAALRPVIGRAVQGMENRRSGVNSLFNIPLIFAAALLSFAHGANDVANAVGPLSAIVAVARENALTAKVGIPLWVMVIGAIGISIGLGLFGAKLIRTVGTRLTRLDQTRAFCICLSAAITVIAASAMGLPVSSTHIAIGSVFGIGIYREYRFRQRSPMCGPRKLFRRRELLTIGSAWLITVPSAAMIAAILFKIMAVFVSLPGV